MSRAPSAVFEHARYLPGPELGRGAQGVVLRVHDREAPSRALVAKLWLDGAFREQALLGEFALLARARVPGLVRAHDLARCARTGAPFLIEDFVDGPEVGEHLGAAPLSARGARLQRLLAELAATLAALHDAGFAHGDLKPAHVRMVRGQGELRPVILDLGAAVARAREASAPLGLTPAYAAPEQLAGAPPGPLSDLYALGALAFAICAGEPPRRGARPPLRALAPWVPPSVASVIDELLAEHPRDRPASARALLFRLGLSQQIAGLPPGHPPPPVGRERELAALLAPSRSAVRYLIGESGTGKSHLVRELGTRALLEGRRVRALSFPFDDAATLARLVAFFRGSAFAFPFVDELGRGPLLLLLDGLDRAPHELCAALEVFRCRAEATELSIVATARSAPPEAETIALGPLDDAGFVALCHALSIDDPEAIAEQRASSGRNPGFVVASLGRVPLTRDTALGRVRGLSPRAASLLAAVALAGGELGDALCRRFLLGSSPTSTMDHSVDDALGELGAAALLGRRALPSGLAHVLAAPALAADLGAALGSPELADRLAAALLEAPEAPVSALLSLALGSAPPSRPTPLLERAAARARAEGLRAQEIEALRALAEDRAGRTPERLCRLERLCRDGGSAQSHPEVLGFLEDAAKADPALRPLALRRRAEARAREGDSEGARALAVEARAVAAARGDALGEALSLGTQGLCALFRADWAEADRAITEARARLATLSIDDLEEVARLDHNLGVIALYRGRSEEAIAAFERSLEVKRSLGDRAGMRSCLLNLGLALAKVGRLAEAERVLGESLRLAGSLGQAAGRGWCLSALADVAVRRRDPGAASALIAEARLHEAALPSAVRADLVILRAQVALLEHDGARALAELSALAPKERAADALIDARARVHRGGRRARVLARGRPARRAARARRRPHEPQGLAARGRGAGPRRAARRPRRERAPLCWEDGIERGSAARRRRRGPVGAARRAHRGRDAGGGRARALARPQARRRAGLRDRSGRGGEALLHAWGADLDGLPIAEARGRIDESLARAALARGGPVYLREQPILGGKGSRLGVAAPKGRSPRALVVLEHRFLPAAFDRVTPEEAARWATLASLVSRLDGPATAVVDPNVDDGSHERPLGYAESPRASKLPSSKREVIAVSTAVPLLEPRRSFPTVLGASPALRRALARLDAAIDSELPVLIAGETGTGKELFARALHELGPRSKRALVTVNCGAIPDALFEAELFGHARGSFTGAERARAGLLARAEGGTLFLDEIGELPLLRQAGLLRALQEKRYRPVGSDEELPFDVRIVAATNRDLEQAVADKEFRQDLLYRLNAVEIDVPPLRERREDIPALFAAFLARAGSSATLSPEAEARLVGHPFPGNVRELEHLAQRLAGLGVARIEVEHLPRQIRASHAAAPRERVAAPERAAPVREGSAEGSEREEVERALSACGGNISRAAGMLGLTRHGLKKRMVRLGMRAPRVAPEAKEKVG
jgi:serine/threonine-protein kinase PknK